MKAKAQSTTELTIRPPKFNVVKLKIVGTAPYVANKFSEEARQQIASAMAEGSAGQATKGKKKIRPPKDFDADFRGSMHQAADGSTGWLPATALKAAFVRAASMCGIEMTRVKQCLFVEPETFDNEGTPLVKITDGKPERFDAYVRNSNGSPDIRARAKWQTWGATIRVKYDADAMTEDHVKNLVTRAGISVGVGAGRPFSKDSCGMGWGTFEISDS